MWAYSCCIGRGRSFWVCFKTETIFPFFANLLIRVLTLFYMRPSIFSLEVASDNATLLVIPGTHFHLILCSLHELTQYAGYKIHELVNTNFALAVRLYRKAAQQIYDQIEKLLTSSEGVAKGLTGSHFLL
jgi:hypothetical protein